MTDPAARLAVLIDADNVSPSHAAAILAELARYGVPTVKRAYGDWTTQQLSGWKIELGRHAIQPIQQFANTVGKNSTDSALIIDAMDLLYSGNLDAFAIVSSDSDFTRLATRLRDAHRRVATLDAPDDQKARVARRLIALSDASKRDLVRASARLDALLADLDAGRLPVAGEDDEPLGR